MTQEELEREYVDGPQAAKILRVSTTRIRQLCLQGRFKGALKVGSSAWLIPREAVQNHTPLRRGVKPKSERQSLVN